MSCQSNTHYLESQIISLSMMNMGRYQIDSNIHLKFEKNGFISCQPPISPMLLDGRCFYEVYRNVVGATADFVESARLNSRSSVEIRLIQLSSFPANVILGAIFSPIMRYHEWLVCSALGWIKPESLSEITQCHKEKEWS